MLISVPQSRMRTRRLEAGEEDLIRAVGNTFINDFMTGMLLTACRPGELRTLRMVRGCQPNHHARVEGENEEAAQAADSRGAARGARPSSSGA